MDIHSIHLGGGTEDPQPRPSWISLFLASTAMVPIAVGTVAAFSIPRLSGLLIHLTVTWAGAVVCFLSGVRRGISFRQFGGPTVAQIVTMMCLFILGAVSLLSPWSAPSLVLEIAAFATMAIADPDAARRGEVPRYFKRLRPWQMLVPIVCLAALLVGSTEAPY